MPRYKLILEYDGTDYVGWQIQPNGPSVQGAFEKALASLVGAPVSTEVAGRTDSGVHAVGQVVCFDTDKEWPQRAFQAGLNGFLPPDIAVRSVEPVAADFDPRRHNDGKRYRYSISNRPGRSALRRRTHWEVFSRLDAEAMARAAGALVGNHDFSAFRAADCDAPHARREIRALEVRRGAGDEAELITVEVVGTAFLKHMVRNIVGTLVEVGKGRRPVDWVAEVLASLDRSRAGPTAPAHGLTLVEVFYAGPESNRR